MTERVLPPDFDSPVPPKSPRLVVGLGIVAVIAGLIFLATRGIMMGLAGNLWTYLPLQIYWSFCIYRLSLIMAAKYKSEPPLSSWEIVAVSMIGYAFCPEFDLYAYPTRALDPFNWCWLMAQFYWPAKLGTYISRHERGKFVDGWAVFLVVAASGYVPLLFVSGVSGWMCNSAWFICQFGSITYLLKRNEARGVRGSKSIVGS